jgi:hypothetical protein
MDNALFQAPEGPLSVKGWVLQALLFGILGLVVAHAVRMAYKSTKEYRVRNSVNRNLTPNFNNQPLSHC